MTLFDHIVRIRTDEQIAADPPPPASKLSPEERLLPEARAKLHRLREQTEFLRFYSRSPYEKARELLEKKQAAEMRKSERLTRHRLPNDDPRVVEEDTNIKNSRLSAGRP